MAERQDAVERQQQIEEMARRLYQLKKQYREASKKDQTQQFNQYMDKLSGGSLLSV